MRGRVRAMCWYARAFFSAAALAAAALVGSCGKGESVAESAAREKILLVGNAADPEGLDPALITGLGEFRILSALFEGLVTADSKTLQIRPAAAKSWKISPDGLLYTFKLDENARWSNGERLKAGDFAFAWKRAVNPKLGAEYASMFGVIKNAADIRDGKKKPEALGVRAVDDETLEVILERPTPNFLSMLINAVFYPLHQPTLKKFGAEQSRDSLWTRPENMVSNGPFILKKWSLNDLVEVSKNPLYRAAKKIALNGIRFYPISNVNTEDRAFRAGQLHITDSVSPIRLKSADESTLRHLRNEPVFGVYYYIFNVERAPLNDWRVRKALSISVDRKSIIDNFLRGGQRPALAYIPPNCGGYISPQEANVKESVAQAKKLLEDAGFGGGKNFPRLRLTYNTSEQHKPIAEAIQQMWKKNLGIEVELYNLSWPAYLDARQHGDFDIARSSWFADFPAPENFLENFHSKSGLNHSRYADEVFDSALDASRGAPTMEEKNALAARAEIRLMEKAALMPIYFYSRLNLVSEMVKNWDSNPLDYHNWHGVRLDPNGGNAK